MQSRGMASRAGMVTPGQGGYSAMSTNTEIKISDRPVTQHGVSGMKTASQGPGRRVADTSYYMGTIQNKIKEITSEIQKMNAEVDKFHSESAQYGQLERKYETLIKEVRHLEGQLADYNLSMDKFRTSTEPEEVKFYQLSLQENNQKEAAEIDRIFIAKKEREQQIESLEVSIKQIHEAQENKLKQLHPEKLQQYQRLLEENQEVGAKVMSQRSEIEMIKSKIQHLEMEVEKDKYRQLAVDLTKQVEELRKESEQLEETARTCRMDPDEARQVLLKKLKDDQERMKKINDEIDEIERENSKTRKAVMDLTADLNERKNDRGRDEPSKYEQLLKKDAQMTQFIEGFQQNVENEMQEQLKAKANIVGLLEHISGGVNADVSNMSKARLGEMKEDLSFKSKQMETSQATKVRLEQELQKREVELQKLNNLDGKIAVELESLNETMRKKREEMVHFDKIDELKDAAEATRDLLLRTKRGYLRRRDAIKQQVQAQAVKLDHKKNKLAESETHKTMLSMEKKLRHLTQTTFTMQEYIEKMTRETDFKTTKATCINLVDEIMAKHHKIQRL